MGNQSAIKFYKKVSVFELHPICVEPPNEEERPPPFRVLNHNYYHNRKQTIVIKTKKLKMCSLLNYCFVVKS
jgi:hypothetical protein